MKGSILMENLFYSNILETLGVFSCIRALMNQSFGATWVMNVNIMCHIKI